MSGLRTFAVEGVAEVRITVPVRSICPFDLEVDESVLTITYQPRNAAVELAGLADYLDGYAGREISHEELVVAVRDELVRVLAPAWVVVEDTFAYHKMTLTVRARERA